MYDTYLLFSRIYDVKMNTDRTCVMIIVTIRDLNPMSYIA